MRGLFKSCAWLAALLLLWGLTSQATLANDRGPYLLDFRLPALDGGKRIELRRFEGQPVILLFFEPDCRWCAKQVKTLQALRGAFPDLQVVAIGVHGSPRALRGFVRRHRLEYPALQATDYFRAALGGIPATPFLLLADHKGHVNAVLRGYTAADTLARLLQDLPETAG